jgi:hypothetical protein
MEKSWIRLISPQTRSVLACFPASELEKHKTADADLLVFPKKYLLESSLGRVTKRWGVAIPMGLVRYWDVHLGGRFTLKGAIMTYVPLNPFNLGQANKASVVKQSSWPLLEKYIPGEGMEPIDPWENVLKGSDQQQRIKNLIENYLELVQKREESPSVLYKDPKDGRYFQWIQLDSGETQLCHATWGQWEHAYWERVLTPNLSFAEQDKEFFEAMEVDEQGESCEDDDCSEARVRFSSLCKHHHFEAVRGYPYQN